jgi:monoamine oxidase
MARTELLNFLQDLYLKLESRETSRRSFLRTLGTVSAVSVVGGTRLFSATPPRIAIVGGGIAGLNAALTLQDAGFPFTIYEGSGRIGGRMHSDTTSWYNGQVSEHCGELIDTAHKTILGLAKRFKIPVDDLQAAEPSQSTDTSYLFGQYYTRSQANDDFNAVFQAVKKDAADAGFPTLYNSYTDAGKTLDNLSIYDWIETRVPGGHTSPMGQLLDIAYNIEYGADSTLQSSLNLIYLLAYQSAPGNFRIFGRSNERYHLQGGNERLPQAITASLPASSIQTGSILKRIVQNADGTFTLSFQRGKTTFVASADHVILALPFSVLRTLDYDDAGFSDPKKMAIEQLGYGINAKLHLQFSQRLWNLPGPWGISNGSSVSDTGYQNTWDVTRAQPGATGILVDYTGGSVAAQFSGDPFSGKIVDKDANLFLSQLEPVFKGITAKWNGRATLDTPATNPFLLGSYSSYRKGQFTTIAGLEGQRSGNCHFAGEHCSILFQGFMEGGAEEGARAANEILSDYGA